LTKRTCLLTSRSKSLETAFKTKGNKVFII
jgi:hypothetical protein